MFTKALPTTTPSASFDCQRHPDSMKSTVSIDNNCCSVGWLSTNCVRVDLIGFGSPSFSIGGFRRFGYLIGHRSGELRRYAPSNYGPSGFAAAMKEVTGGDSVWVQCSHRRFRIQRSNGLGRSSCCGLSHCCGTSCLPVFSSW